ncbi:MAG TPA: Rne/Rng family ribonuclease [Actinomycetaceae bacterium]|nr:Rne/Rng family ribonuclease [Actinomycetaceae bacterium]
MLFQAPDPTRVRRRVRAEAGPPRERTAEPAPEPEPQATSTAQPEAASTTTDEESEGAETTAESSGEGGQRRRRRRGGRGRRNRGGAGREESENSEENGDAEGGAEQTAQPAEGAVEDADHDDDTDGEDGTNGDDDANGDSGDGESDDETTSRRRRRRRRSRSADDGTANSREGRAARDEITALKGSTRLEAKRQRRREGRDAGRRRTTITEAEFLARRESVDRSMIVRERDGRTQIAVLEDGVLVEHYVARETHTSMVGNVYLGRVQNVLPSMEAAFVDLGKGRNAVLYAGEVNWDAAGMEGQPRRIEQALSPGDTVLVQVTKDPVGHKGARLTSQITLAGRFLVLVPSGAMTGISRKLPENERARLKKLLKQIVPEGAGVIVRTAAEGATEEQLRADVERLTTMWDEIQAKAKSARSAPVLLKGEPELAVRVVRDVFNEDFGSLVVSGKGAWETISTYVRELSPDLVDRVHHWTHEADVFAEYRIDEQLAKGLDRKVYLPSGGSLVIDRTEAMTVIDVNTGKFTGSGGTLEETVTKNNLEAAEEIVRQLRLRDIGGIIVIDFIDMVLESNRDLVLRRLVECLGRDRTRHQVAEVTSLGLVQMTRKRVGQGLLEAFSEPCEHCGGRGFIVHDHPVEKSAAPAASDGGRRRKRGGNGGRAETLPPVDDAAREAVKATLATIAAAAAQAHAPKDKAKDAAEDRAEDTAEQDVAEKQAPPAAEKAAAASSRPGKRPARRGEADTAGTDTPSVTAEPAAETERKVPDLPLPTPVDRPADAAQGEQRSAEEVRASLEALAAALPAGRQEPAETEARRRSERDGDAVPDTAPGAATQPAAGAGDEVPVAQTDLTDAMADATATADTAAKADTTGAAATADTTGTVTEADTTGTAAKADTTGAAAKADAEEQDEAGAASTTPRRRRGHRRVTSGGPITA